MKTRLLMIIPTIIILALLAPTIVFANSDSNSKYGLVDYQDAEVSLEVEPLMVKFGDDITIHASLPSYKKPDDLRYYVDVFDLEGRKVDSTLWFARTDFNYTMRTEHPVFNITRAGDYTIYVEKALNIERTGEIVKTTSFTIITNPPPLKQVDRGISPPNVICNDNLGLIIKSSDDSPACVKPKSIEKLLQRGWLQKLSTVNLVVPRGDLFLQSLRIEGLNKTYSVGEKIEFTVKFNGTKYGCYTHPTLRIDDSNHQKVWESNTIVELCDPDAKPAHFEKIWDTTNSNLGVPILNKTGTYTLFAEFEKNIIQQDFSVNLIESISDEISASSYICFNHDLSSNSTGVYLTCHNEEYRNIVYDLPDPVYKREDCKSTYGCASKYMWIPQIPKELISEEYKKQILEKVLNLPETKNWPAKSKLDHFNIGTSVDRWEANIQFFVAGFKLPQHNHCEFYDSVNIDLETMEVTSGFRNFTNFEKC